MSTRITADTIGPLNKKNIEAQFCSDWLKDEIFRVFAELDAMEAQFDHSEYALIATLKERDQARADLATAVEALEYYAYKIVPESMNQGQTEITTETGKIARQALAKLGVTK